MIDNIDDRAMTYAVKAQIRTDSGIIRYDEDNRASQMELLSPYSGAVIKGNDPTVVNFRVLNSLFTDTSDETTQGMQIVDKGYHAGSLANGGQIHAYYGLHLRVDLSSEILSFKTTWSRHTTWGTFVASILAQFTGFIGAFGIAVYLVDRFCTECRSSPSSSSSSRRCPSCTCFCFSQKCCCTRKESALDESLMNNS